MVNDFHQAVLNGRLRLPYIRNVCLQAPYPPRTMKERRTEEGRCSTHSKPASPVKDASRFGFSKRHSRDCCRHRLQGGFSAPSQRIFCFLQAFCAGDGQRDGKVSTNAGKLTQAPGEVRGQSQRRHQGRDCGRTGNPVQGSSDGLDVLSTTSILDGLQLFDKVRTGRACAVDVHDDRERERGG